MSTVSKICGSLVAIFTLAVLVTLVTRGTLRGAGGPGPPPDIGSGVSGPIAAAPEGVARDSREAIVGAAYPEPESGGDDGDAEADVRSMHLVVLDGSTNRPVPEASVVGARATWETDVEGRVQCATAGFLWVYKAGYGLERVAVSERGSVTVFLFPEERKNVIVESPAGSPLMGTRLERAALSLDDGVPWSRLSKYMPVAWTTDANGHCAVGVVPNDRDQNAVRVYRAEGLFDLCYLDQHADPVRIVVDPLKPALRLEVRCSERGWDPRGKVVTVRLDSHTFRAELDDSGEATLNGMPLVRPQTGAQTPAWPMCAELVVSPELAWHQAFDYRCSDSVLVMNIGQREVTVHMRGWKADAYEIATASADAPEAHLWIHPHPEENRLRWKLAEGPTTKITAGWQGPRNCVLLRDVATRIVLAQALVDFGSAEITVPRWGRLELAKGANCDQDQALVQLEYLEAQEENDDGLVLPQYPSSSLPVTVALPLGSYRIAASDALGRRELGTVQVNGKMASFLVDLPEQRQIEGILRGTMSGPIHNTRVQCYGKGFQSTTRTDGEGRFRLAAMAGAPATIKVEWKERLWANREPAAESVDYSWTEDGAFCKVTRREAALVFEREGGALAIPFDLVVKLLSDGRPMPLGLHTTLSGGRLEFFVPAGEYRASVAYRDWKGAPVAIASVAEGETRRVGMSVPSEGFLKVDLGEGLEGWVARVSLFDSSDRGAAVIDVGIPRALKTNGYMLDAGEYRVVAEILEGTGGKPISTVESTVSIKRGSETRIEVIGSPARCEIHHGE